jgi:MFS superfamily sulfate permease-like transporter
LWRTGVNLPVKIYTEEDLDRARGRGRVVGWVQGAGALFLAGVVLNLLGWIPTLLVAGGVTYVGYRLLTRRKKDDDDE